MQYWDPRPDKKSRDVSPVRRGGGRGSLLLPFCNHRFSVQTSPNRDCVVMFILEFILEGSTVMFCFRAAGSGGSTVGGGGGGGVSVPLPLCTSLHSPPSLCLRTHHHTHTPLLCKSYSILYTIFSFLYVSISTLCVIIFDWSVMLGTLLSCGWP